MPGRRGWRVCRKTSLFLLRGGLCLAFETWELKRARGIVKLSEGLGFRYATLQRVEKMALAAETKSLRG